MQNLRCLGEAEWQTQVGSWIQRRGLGQRYNCGHHWAIEAIKATSVEETDPGKWVACCEKGNEPRPSLEALQHLIDGARG